MIAAIFPGQGSQKPEMGKELVENFEAANQVFDLVSNATGRNARELCFELDEDTLRHTENAQLALYTCGVAAYKTFPVGEVFAGHSVGEYAALAAAGVVTVEQGALLVKARGEIMANAGSGRKGTMAAVLGLERDNLAVVCAEASSSDGVVVIANDNCPGQLVISGDVVAVERASKLASEAGAKRVLPLNVSGAFHSPLMEESAIQMGSVLRGATFHAGKAVIANVTADIVSDVNAWPNLLEQQLKSSVRWTESVQKMIVSGATIFVEYGVGEVLCGLVRRVDKEVKTCAVNDLASLDKAKEVCQ